MGGEALITADHGNAEQMRGKETGQAHTAHTSNVVPLLYLGRPADLEEGALSDIMPSVIHLLGMHAPVEMTGRSLVTLTTEDSEIDVELSQGAEV